MIKGFLSKAGNGKSLILMMEAAAQENKKVAFISLEMDSKTIQKRLDAIKPKTKEFNVYTPNSFSNLETWLCKKIQKLCDEVDIICIDEVDIICIDAVDVTPKKVLEKLHKACFGNFMSQCDELWVSLHMDHRTELTLAAVHKTEEENEFFKVKQICQKTQNNLLPGVNFIEAIDLETNEVKTYNLSNIFKNN